MLGHVEEIHEVDSMQIRSAPGTDGLLLVRIGTARRHRAHLPGVSPQLLSTPPRGGAFNGEDARVPAVIAGNGRAGGG